MVSKNYYKLAYYNFVKQSKAKPLLYLLTNNLNFYILQFFKAFNFLYVLFSFAKNFVIPSICQNAKESRLNKIRFYNLASLISDCHANANGAPSVKLARTRCALCGDDYKNNFAILNLVKTFLTSKTFDTYRGKRRNLVCINKKIFQGDIK